jgi:hypothetical protein
MLLYVNQKRGNLQDQFEQYWHSWYIDVSFLFKEWAI